MIATEILRVDPSDAAASEPIRRAAEILRAGGLVAFPTETVYGLGGDATSQTAVEAIFVAKERPADNPLIVHLADVEEIERYARPSAEIESRLAALLRRFWPGPLTVVLPARENVRAATRGLTSAALRLPDHPIARALIAAAGVPLAAPSANRSGRPSPTLARHVLADLDGRVDLILDGGPCRVGIESTVLDLSGDVPCVLRPGAITAEQIAEVWGTPIAAGAETSKDAHKSPGTRYRHYRPRTPVLTVDAAPDMDDVARLRGQYGPEIVYLTLGPQKIEGVQLRRYRDAAALAQDLYAAFREADDAGASLILVDRTHDPALEDRLRRAASGTV